MESQLKSTGWSHGCFQAGNPACGRDLSVSHLRNILTQPIMFHEVASYSQSLPPEQSYKRTRIPLVSDWLLALQNVRPFIFDFNIYTESFLKQKLFTLKC